MSCPCSLVPVFLASCSKRLPAVTHETLSSPTNGTDHWCSCEGPQDRASSHGQLKIQKSLGNSVRMAASQSDPVPAHSKESSYWVQVNLFSSIHTEV